MKRKDIVPALLIGVGLMTLSGCGGAKETVSPPATESSVSESINTTEENMSKEKNYDKLITVDFENRVTTNNGEFEGFGTALCWWANRIGMSEKLVNDSAKLFYSSEGLDFNILRYNIGGGDDPTHNHIKRSDSNMPGFLYPDGNGGYKYDFEADYRQLNVLKKCYEAATDPYVEVFSNSAPYFMTISGCTGGAENPSENNLKPECYEDFAEYLAVVSEYINNDLGIKVKSVSPINEPDTNYWGAMSEKQEGAHMDPGEAQSKIIVDTRKAFDAHSLNDVIVAASDETSTASAMNSYQKYSDEAKEALGRLSTHTYITSAIKSLGALREKEGFNMWMSEVDGDGSVGTDSGEMGSALWMAEKIITDINDLKPSAWVMWQVINSFISKDGFNGNPDSGMVDVNKGFWGATVADCDKEEIILTQKYYAIGQFSRYIRPGSTLIITDSENSLASYDKNTGTLTIVAVNDKKEDKTFSFDIKGFDIKGNVNVIRTSGSIENGEHWDEVDNFKFDGELNYNLPTYSITTFVIDGVKLN